MGNREAEERGRQRGEAERREREQRERAALAEKAERAQELEERLRLSCHRAWLLVDSDSFTGSWVVTLIVAAALVDVMVAWLLLGSKPTPDVVRYGPLVAEVSAAVFVGLLLMRGLINRQASATWAKEQAWLFALPFKHEGYQEAVGSVSGRDRLELRVTFEGPAVHQLDEARTLLAKVDPGGKVTHDNDRLRLEANLVGDEDQERVDAVREARLLFRDLVDGVLLPLHHRSRVVRVEISS